MQTLKKPQEEASSEVKAAPSPTRRLHILDLLRGLAALAVCACHFSATLPEAIGEPIHTYGAYGVEVFFVISGFIIPYGMSRAGYDLRNYWQFMLKRLARLHPPYLVALLVTLVVSYLAAKVTHNSIRQSPSDILQYLFYLRAPGTNPVYWTLRVEMEYYLLIGLTFGFFTSSKFWIRGLAFVLALGTLFIHGTPFKIFPFVAFFLMGIATFLRYQNKITRYEHGIWLGIFTLAACVAQSIFPAQVIPDAVPVGTALEAVPTSFAQLCVPTAVALATALIILTVQIKPRPITEFLGEISYSLYLIHFVIGIKFLNFLQGHFHGLVPRLGLFFLTFAVTIGVAYVLFLLIERPSMRWSSAVRYSPKKTALEAS